MTDDLRRLDEIVIEDWRQFESVRLRFHPRLTVLTGANGAGKTTILNLISRHFGWTLPFSSTPGTRSERLASYLATRRKREEVSASQGAGTRRIGELTYSDGNSTALVAPTEAGNRYEVTFAQTVDVPGIYVTSHRPVYTQQQVETIAPRIDSIEQILNRYLELNRGRYSAGASQSPTIRIKEALISWAAFGLGNEVVARNEFAADALDGFVTTLRTFLPAEVGFRRFRVDGPHLILETSHGPFSFDSSSGGVAALIDLAWQTYLYSLLKPAFVLVIDEPENHLHPKLQRALLPKLLTTFPTLQVVVATHNPLIVGSVEDSKRIRTASSPGPRRVCATPRNASQSIVRERNPSQRAGDRKHDSNLGRGRNPSNYRATRKRRPRACRAHSALRSTRAPGYWRSAPDRSSNVVGPTPVISLSRGPEPAVLVANAVAWTAEYLRWAARPHPPGRPPARYRHPDLKASLRLSASDKCAYCESRVGHVYWGDVEHILPRTVRPDLVVVWTNLAYVCAICNGKKRAYFDTARPLIDPYTEDPLATITFLDAICLALRGDARGATTVETVQLNRAELLDRRRDPLRTLDTLIDGWNRLRIVDPVSAATFRDTALSFTTPGSEYSAACIALVRSKTGWL